ncbi:uncharacterized protein LOC124343739 isoform X1 [Daphnia pulicaria]|uniref:uncharacterized protein LOC124343739 isoform X1 n=2 Tax=Daphnia pulicaria TaxID=35523 RepID=UPI001EEB1D53|nr:uncharacterized protein LOC124343739 isoform X1 [Daphnia pulicaria]
MEQQSQATNDDGFLTLATRKCLFRLLSFLDSRLPECSAIHSFVCAALLTANPSSHVYFRKASNASGDEENYSLIIGLGVECFVQPNQQTKKFWTVTAWTDDDEKLASAFETINIIDWNTDAVIMHYKFHAPHPAIDNLVKNKHGEGKDNKICYPCDQYFMPLKDALNLQISEIDGVYVKSLERCHAQIVYDYWPYRESTTVENITREIEQLPSAGVFLKGNDQLVSWMMCHPPNGMSRLHTLEEHRHRGYASLVTQYLSRRVAQCGLVPFVNIVIENTASYKFFEIMKFKHLRPTHVQFSTK